MWGANECIFDCLFLCADLEPQFALDLHAIELNIPNTNRIDRILKFLMAHQVSVSFF